MSDVVMVDAYYYEGNINLIVQDIRSHRVFAISHCLECPENDYSNWILVDFDYFIDRMNAKVIKQYCGNCNDSEKKPNAEINSKNIRDDLLEFEF